MLPLDTLVFDNRLTRGLIADPSGDNFPRQVHGAHFSRVAPTETAGPTLVAYSREMAELLGVDPTTEDFAAVFSGNRVPADADPHAACYGGHQFGHWAGQLGDGRAISLGEVVATDGSHWTLQLKGAGRTPYSRGADGLAVLRSSVREFLCSEAMHHLGVPTTRALSLTLTGDRVLRDMFYDGNPAYEPGAVVCRVAPSFTRFGSFEIFTSRDEVAPLRQLADLTIATDFPELGAPSPEVYGAWFSEVCRRTAEMVLHWMRVGFVHGVMNTDNMSILGLTIDYGPYGWLEDYQPGWTPNTTDREGRYAYGRQPSVAHWNLLRLANAIYPLIGAEEPLHAGLDRFVAEFDRGSRQMLSEKLGLAAHGGEADDQLIAELLAILPLSETDMTIFFRALADVPAEGEAFEVVRPAYYGEPADEAASRMRGWLARYQARVGGEDADARRARMRSVNPRYVLRNYLAQLAIDDAEQGSFGLIDELLEVLRRPYDDQPGKERFAEKRPEWARNRPGCSALS